MATKTNKSTKKITGAESAATTSNDPPNPADLYEMPADAKNSDYYDPQNLKEMLFLTESPELENNLINLADLFAASGLFGNKTPAQIAVQILAGRELGFGAVESMYDLKIAPGESAIKIASLENPSFRQMRNQLALLPKANKAALSASNSESDTLPAPTDKTHPNDTDGINAPSICPACLRQKPALRFMALDCPELIGVYFCSPTCALTGKDNLRAAKRNEASRNLIENAAAAAAIVVEATPELMPGQYYADATGKPIGVETNDQPAEFAEDMAALSDGLKVAADFVDDTTAEDNDPANWGDPPPIDTFSLADKNDLESIESVGAIINAGLSAAITTETLIKSDDKQKSNLKDTLSKNPRNDVKPETDAGAEPEKEAEKVNIESDDREEKLKGADLKEIQKACKVWRVQLNDMLTDLGYDLEAVKKKLSEYDGLLSWSAKLEKLKKCEQFYNERLSAVKTRIFAVIDDPAQFLHDAAGRKQYLLENLLKPEPFDKYDYADFAALEKCLIADKILKR